MKFVIPTFVVTGIILFIAIYVLGMLPTLAFGYYGIGFCFLVLTIVSMLWSEDGNNVYTSTIFIISLIATGCLLIIFPLITTWNLFHSSDYHQLLKSHAEIQVVKETLPISDPAATRIVDIEQARLIASSMLGENEKLVTISELSQFTEQEINGEWYWIAALQHNSYWTWRDNKAGTFGYIKISSIDENDRELILNDREGKEILLKYQPEAYYSTDLERLLYRNGYKTRPTTDYTYEVDDLHGYGWWVCTIYEKTIGYSGSNAIGVVVVDPANGSKTEYSIENAPDWIDCIQPRRFINKQINYWGEFVDGWKFSKEHKLARSVEVDNIRIGKDKYYYTGITSQSSDRSNTSYMLVNTRNKQVLWCKRASVMESLVRHEAEARVQNFGYIAGNALPYNQGGLATYVMSLKTESGSRQLIAFGSMDNYEIIGIGKTKREAFNNYKASYSKENHKDFSKNLVSSGMSLKGKITRISDILEGNVRAFMLDTNDSLIFRINEDVSSEILLTNLNDEVIIEFDQTEGREIIASGFENINITGQ